MSRIEELKKENEVLDTLTYEEEPYKDSIISSNKRRIKELEGED